MEKPIGATAAFRDLGGQPRRPDRNLRPRCRSSFLPVAYSAPLSTHRPAWDC